MSYLVPSANNYPMALAKANNDMTNLTLPKPKAIIFDWDNTLVDTWPIIHDSLVETFEHMGEEAWSFEETKAKVGKSMRDHFPEIFGDKWEEAGDIYVSKYRENHLEALAPLPDVIEMLEFVAGTDLFRAVVSNKQGPTLRREAEHIGWDKYFHKLVGANDASRDKPFADPALLALKGSGITPGKNVWFVGDSTPDVDCAKAAGLTPIIYGNKELAAYSKGEIHFVETHVELKNLIDEHFERDFA